MARHVCCPPLSGPHLASTFSCPFPLRLKLTGRLWRPLNEHTVLQLNSTPDRVWNVQHACLWPCEAKLHWIVLKSPLPMQRSGLTILYHKIGRGDFNEIPSLGLASLYYNMCTVPFARRERFSYSLSPSLRKQRFLPYACHLLLTTFTVDDCAVFRIQSNNNIIPRKVKF